MDASERRSALAAVVLLLALTFLAAVAMAGQSDGASCAVGAALPILPLRVDYVGFRLQAYGRSAATVPPGSALCLALEWRPSLLSPSGVPTILIELIGEEGQVVGRYVGPAIAEGTHWIAGAVIEAQYPLPIAPYAADGRYLIALRVLDRKGDAVPSLDGRTDLILGTLYVDAEAAPPSGLLEGLIENLHFKGHLRQWPFWPPIRTDEKEA